MMTRHDMDGMFEPFETFGDYDARAEAMLEMPAVRKKVVDASIVGLYESTASRRCLNGDKSTPVEFVEFNARNGESRLSVHVPEHRILVVVSKGQVWTQNCPLVHRATKKRVAQNLLGVRVPCFYNNSACALEVLWQGREHFLQKDNARH